MSSLGFLLAVGAVLGFVASLSDEGLDRADKLSSVGSLVIGVAALLVGGLALWGTARGDGRESASAGADEALMLDWAADGLADAVYRQWTNDAGLQQLRRPQPLRVRWLTTTRLVSAQPPAVLGEGVVSGRPTRLKLRGDLDCMVETFHQLPARQLVVLGEPGAGKTVLAMLFTLRLLKIRAPGEPVPVLLPISSWNPQVEYLHTWLARRLAEDYPALTNTYVYGLDAAARLIDSGRLILVLDGLDEMLPALYDTAIEALDRAVADGSPLVMTCRSNEYQSAVFSSGRFLSRAAVVEIEPVKVDDAIDFLTAAQGVNDTRWQPVFDCLRNYPDGQLAQALSTPLMVYLARIAYTPPTTTPAELCDPDRFSDHIAIEDHLLDVYLPSVYGGRPIPGRSPAVTRRWYPPELARRWLTFIACHLDEQQTRDLAWWQLYRSLPHRGRRLIGGLVLGLIDGLVCGIAVGIGAGVGGFVAGFTGALVAGITSGLTPARPSYPRQVSTRTRKRQRQFSQKFIVELAAMVGLGIPVGIAAGLAIGLVEGLVVGIIAGLTVWFIGGLAEMLYAPADMISSPSPISVLRNDKIVSLMQMLFVIFGVGLTSGLAVAVVSGIIVRPVVGLAVGLVGGLTSGLIIGLMPRSLHRSGLAASAWGWFLLSRWWLALADKLPWGLMVFLDDAHQRGVLRQTGAVYQFRHARLQDHLVTLLQQPSTNTEQPVSYPHSL